MVEFTDGEDIERWLDGRPRAVAVALAARSALRALPGVCGARPETIGGLALATCRATLTSAVAAVGPTAEVRIQEAAHSAAASAAHSAAASAAVSFDADALGDGRPVASVFQTPLWPIDTGAWDWEEFAAPLKAFFETDPGTWGFWARWYEGMLRGTPLPWDLQEAVALIPNEDWEAGPERVAKRIRGIEAAYLAMRLPQAELIELNPETSKFRAVPIPVAKPDLLGATLSQVDDALDDALANPSNGLTERSREAKVLRRTLSKYGNNPQQIEIEFVSVAQGLRRQLFDTEELPKSEENLALLSSVEQGALGIRATHPEVAENREILAHQALRELLPDEKDLMADAAPLLEAISENAVAEDFAQDIPELINDAIGPVPRTAPPLPGVARTFSRISKMKQIYDGIVEKGANVFDSKGFKTVRLGLKVGRVLSELVQLGLRILGIL